MEGREGKGKGCDGRVRIGKGRTGKGKDISKAFKK